MMYGSLEQMPYLRQGKSRAINAENRTGEKGKAGMAASDLGQGRKGSPCLKQIMPSDTVTLANIDGCGIINHIWITTDYKTGDADCFLLRDIVLRMYWDKEEEPSVEVPLGDFFCCGFGQTYPVHSQPIVVLPRRGFNCYFPMPFHKQARITIENQHKNPIREFFYQIDYNLYDDLPDNTAYFHAQWRRQPITEKANDYVILDGVKGRGVYVGTCLQIQALERYWWGEGEVKFYIDHDEAYPTICSTGLEDYFGGSWSFAKYDKDKDMTEDTYSTAYMGYPFYSRDDDLLRNPYHNTDVPPMRAFYRFHIPDPVFFAENIKVTVQQIGASYRGLFERQDDYTSVAYWYQDEPHHPFPELCGAAGRWPR